MTDTSELALSNTFERTGIHYAWWAVVSRFLLHGLIVSAWVSRIPAIQTTLGLSNASLGFCLLGTAVGSVIAVPATGWLVARFGSKRVTTWSTLGFCLALVTPTLAVSSGTLFAALTLYGAMAGANDVAINSQGVAVEKLLGTPTMSRFHGMFSIGGMVGAFAGSIMAAHDVTPRLHLGIAAALFLVLSVSTAPLLLEADVAEPTRSTGTPATRFRPSQLPGALITLTIIGFCMFLSEGAMADWTAVYMKQTLAAGAGLAAAGYAVFSAGMAIFRLAGDAVTKLLGPVNTVRTGALVAAAGLTVALSVQSTALALVGFGLTGAGFSVIVPLVFGAGGSFPGVPKGAGIAIVSGSGYIGFLFGPPLIGLVAQHSSLRFALFLVVGLSLLAAALAKALRVSSPAQQITATMVSAQREVKNV
jgi:MFS family permease